MNRYVRNAFMFLHAGNSASSRVVRAAGSHRPGKPQAWQ